MDYLAQSIEAIAEAQRKLWQIVGAAAEAGHQDQIIQIAALAERLAGLLSGFSRVDAPLPDRATYSGPSRSPIHTGPTRELRDPTSDDHLPSSYLQVRRYPYYYREGGKLIKVGRSVSSGTEYSHKAGRAILDRVVDAIVDSIPGKRFSVDQLNKLGWKDGNQRIPSYQVYLCIGWLNSVGLLKPHGRQGYSVPNKTELREGVEEKWLQATEV